MLAFHGAQAPPRLADQRARACSRSPTIVPSVQVDSFYTALIAALLLGFVNTLIRPLIVLLTLPATVLHARPLHLRESTGFSSGSSASFVKGFSVAGFWSAFFGAIVYALILLGGERPRLRPAAHRRGAARGAPLAESAGLPARKRGEKYAICQLCVLISSSRLGT